MPSYAQRLHDRLGEIVEMQDALLDVSTIIHEPNEMERWAREGIVAILPKSRWDDASAEARRLQRRLLLVWTAWSEHAQHLLRGDAPAAQRRLNDAADQVTRWFQRSEADFSIPPTIEEAEEKFREHVAPLFEVLAPFMDGDTTVVVPDTNVLLRNRDLPSWSTSVGRDDYTVLLVPGVLAEIDEHKVNHRNPDVREKARKVSDRIKGWRKQGSLSDGVRVQGDIHVKVAAREPSFENTLSWLDANVVDDRILASLLAYQWANPSEDVVLLTGDTVMLTKADEAMIPSADVPDPQAVP